MKFFYYLALLAAVAGFSTITAFAQETQTKVVDEVVAQVNDGVITLSRIKREIKEIVDAEVQQGKDRQTVEKEINERQGELIANLINEELVIQKAKEMGLEKEIDAAVNQRLLEVMKQANLKTVESLFAEMEKSGVAPDEYKDTIRKQITREMVVQQEVQSKIYWGFSGKELKSYYDAHKERFTKPETVSVSELYLGFAGRDPEAIRTKARQLLTVLRAGANFDTVVKENGDPGLVTQGQGKAEKLRVNDLTAVLANPLKGVKPGDYTEPFEADKLGMVILRVDSREAASNESMFDENTVRMAMLGERAPTETKKFFSKLRSEAYIKISESYRPIVSPVLFADERKDKAN